MDFDKILHIATFAGRIILESGGETYRVEETICKICQAYGVRYADSFVTPTGIMVSVYDENNYTTTLVKRVTSRTVNLQKIHLVNELSRKIYIEKYSLDEVLEKLIDINQNCPKYDLKTNLIFSGMGAAGFTTILGGKLEDCLVSFFVGMFVQYVTIKFSNLGINAFFVNSLGGAIAALLSLIAYNLGIGTSLDTMIIGSIMLLVPGLAITNAIRDTIAGDLISGIIRTAEAFLIAISIAVGTGMVMSFWISLGGGI
ncbi:threonine/serine exporter family protein [Clostridium sp.]|uniref:threonine/serine exporter family protein n=1 Tax=Clostridium sp. TaxID=1506 RepID=UPI002612FDA3|nr:threonine/serine exporter family protein [Clostridium sp.]